MLSHSHKYIYNHIKENITIIVLGLFNINLSFLCGYLVFSPLPFLHLVDGSLVFNALNQFNIFCSFAAFLWMLNLKINFIEPAPSGVDVIHNIFLKLPFFILAFIFIIFTNFTNFYFKPFIYIYIMVIIATFFLYSEKHSAKNVYSRSLKLYCKYPKKSWNKLSWPYIKRYAKSTSIILIPLTFIFLGAQRFEYVKNERKFEYKLIDGEVNTASFIGKNNNGLIFYTKGNEYIVVPESSIIQLFPIVDKK